MSKHNIKPRPFILASQLCNSMEEAEKCLSEYCKTGNVNFVEDVFSFSHNGHWSVKKLHKEATGLVNWDISYLIDTHHNGKETLFTINLKNLLELMQCLVVQSPQDYEYYQEMPHSEEQANNLGIKTWLDDKFIAECEKKKEWQNRYKQIEGLENALHEIWKITEIDGIVRNVIKDYILDKAFYLSGFMAQRYIPFMPDYEKCSAILKQGKDKDRIKESANHIQPALHFIFERLLLPNRDLFTNSIIKDLVKHITNIYIVYHYDELGRFIVCPSGTN